MDGRYIPIEQSIIDSFKEIKAMREGRQREKTWKEFLAELKEEERMEPKAPPPTKSASQTPPPTSASQTVFV